MKQFSTLDSQPILATMLAAAILVATAVSAPAAESQTVTLDQFNQMIAERDRIIIDLLQRVEKLEGRLIEKPTGAIVMGEETSTVESKPMTPEAEATPASGTLMVDELTAQRALERGLVEGGNLLLDAGQMEVVPSFLYQRGEFDAATAVQQGGNIFVANTESEVDTFDAGLTFRHGLPFYAQFEASLPYRFVLREDTTDVGGALVSSSNRDGSGIGDLRLGLAKTLLREEEWWPSLIGRFTWDTATGDQRDDGLALGFGFHELEASLTALYTADPMVFFGTIGYEHAFEKDDLDPGDSVSLILGTAVAVSPETSLTFSLDQTYREDFELNGRKVDGSDRLSSNFNFGTSTILGPRTLLTISASIGLTEGAPNYSLGIALPIRFNSPIQ